MARFEPKSALKMAQFKPKYLAQFDRKGWHKSNRYIQMEGAVLERLELSDGILNAKGMTLDGLVKYLNSLHDEKYYFYEGSDSGKYYFELDVSNPQKLGRSLNIYGISLEICQVNVNVVEVK